MNTQFTSHSPRPAGAAQARSGVPLLALLRQQTSEQHAALDARLAPSGAPMSPQRYLAFLRATSAIVVPLEVPLSMRLGSLFARGSGHERRERLTRDLALLDSRPADPWPTLPRIEDVPSAFGAAYVVLGSHLGGEVIARELFGRDAGDDTPTAYVKLYHPDVGGMWRRFAHALDALDATLDDTARQHAAAVAVAVFTAFGLALDREGVAR